MVPIQFLTVLADGQFHSGQALAKAFSVTRAGVWKWMCQLREFGLTVDAVSGRGYRLRSALELLNVEAIRSHLPQALQHEFYGIEIVPVIKSTNHYLSDKAQDRVWRTLFERTQKRFYICLAEYQTEGRGRRGRLWHSPFGSNLLLSMLCRFELPLNATQGMTLVLAVAGMRALRALGVCEAGIKWPNDFLWQRRKLGGILTELHGEDSGPCYAVVGLGLNVNMAQCSLPDLDQAWVALDEILKKNQSRNHVAALFIREVSEALLQFEREGLAPFIPAWREYDLCCDQEVEVHFPSTVLRGVVRGIDEQGCLILSSGGQDRRLVSGEISVRWTS